MRELKELLEKLVGKYVKLWFTVINGGSQEEVEGYLEEVGDSYLVLRTHRGHRIYLFNVVIYGVVVERAAGRSG